MLMVVKGGIDNEKIILLVKNKLYIVEDISLYAKHVDDAF